MTPEKKIKIAILKAIGSRPDMLVEQRDVGFDEVKKIKYGTKGEADIRVLWKRTYRVIHKNNKNPFHQFEREETKEVGQALAIEVKSKTGRQRPEQKKWQKAWEAMGGIYILTNSVADLERQLLAVDLQDEYILVR